MSSDLDNQEKSAVGADLELLFQAARTDPILRDGVERVRIYVTHLQEALDATRDFIRAESEQAEAYAEYIASDEAGDDASMDRWTYTGLRLAEAREALAKKLTLVLPVLSDALAEADGFGPYR